MAVKQNNMECTVVCWSVAAFVGVVSMVMLYMVADFSALQAIFCGGAIGTVLGVVLSLMLCRGSKAVADLSAAEKPAQRYAREAAEDKAYRAARLGNGGGAAEAAPAPAENPAPAAAATAPAAAVTASKELPGEADLAARKGEWKYEGDAEKADAPAEDTPVKEEPVAEVSQAETPAPAADDKPASMIVKPRAEGADDLKLISGVGPKLEQTLNELGIWHFDQVAAWKKADIAWVDERLRFKGRIERDDWMSQAKVLAKGGETEFSKKKKK